MAGSKNDYYELEILKWATGQTNDLGTAPTPYLALYTTAPTDAGGGVEVTGGSYARHDSSGKWAAPSAGAVANNAECAFPRVGRQLSLLGRLDGLQGGEQRGYV